MKKIKKIMLVSKRGWILIVRLIDNLKIFECFFRLWLTKISFFLFFKIFLLFLIITCKCFVEFSINLKLLVQIILYFITFFVKQFNL